MNPRNVIHLEGRIHGAAWRRWKPAGSGEVRFALNVPSAHGTVETFVCAIPVMTLTEAEALERELAEGRSVSLQGELSAIGTVFLHDAPMILVVVKSHEFDVGLEETAHLPPQGKTAAAHDDLFELKAS